MKLYQKNNVCYLLLIFLFFGCESKEQLSEKNVVAVNGVKLHYKIEGSGITTMVIGSAIQQPRMFSQELRKQFKFIFVDTRLFIPTNIEKFSLDDAVEDIEGIRKYLNINKMVIMGNSILAIIALEYVKKYPNRVSHLVMIGISPIFDDFYYKERNKYWESHATKERKQIWKENKKKLTNEALKNVSPGKARVLRYVANGPKRCYDAKYDASWLFEGVTVNVSKGIQNFVKSYYRYDITKNIQTITTPVLLVLGRYDFNNPYYLWNDFKSKFPYLEYHLFDKSGHHPMLEETKLFNQTFIEFIYQHNNKLSLNTAKWLPKAVETGIPILGICYGHQLLAHAMGGRAGFHPNGFEIGTVRVSKTRFPNNDLLFCDLPASFEVQVNHTQSVLRLPPKAKILASNTFEPHQAFVLQKHAWGVQFHPEFDQDIMKCHIMEQKDLLLAGGYDIDQLMSAVRPCLFGKAILNRFCEIALEADKA